jgi:hypothetical protein
MLQLAHCVMIVGCSLAQKRMKTLALLPFGEFLLLTLWLRTTSKDNIKIDL